MKAYLHLLLHVFETVQNDFYLGRGSDINLSLDGMVEGLCKGIDDVCDVESWCCCDACVGGK